MADFGSLEDIARELDRMAEGDDPLVGRLPRRPGQKEERWAEILSAAPISERGASAEIMSGPDRVQGYSIGDEIAALRAEVDTLQQEVGRIAASVTELRTALGL